jgi:hypothetical protein
MDIGYAQTRRSGRPVTVVRLLSVSVNPATGQRMQNTESYWVRNVVKQPTSYSRFITANATQRDVGETTFLFWTRDVPFTTLQTEDYILVDGEKYQVVDTYLDFTILSVSATFVAGSFGGDSEKSVSQSIGLTQDTADDVETP